jgi:hypothetical protein
VSQPDQDKQLQIRRITRQATLDFLQEIQGIAQSSYYFGWLE